MDDENLVLLEGDTGEFDKTYETTNKTVSGNQVELTLLILTTIFLFISTLIVGIKLYSTYDVGKSHENIHSSK